MEISHAYKMGNCNFDKVPIILEMSRPLKASLRKSIVIENCSRLMSTLDNESTT